MEIDPCLPQEMKEYTVKRKLRDNELVITVKNPHGKQKGVSRITVDGRPIESCVVKALPGKHVVVVEM